MDVWERALKDREKGMKYKEIAEKYSVSENTVKSWATRYWKPKKVATKDRKRLQPSEKKLQPKKTGAPQGNMNARGNKGGGAPARNRNNEKHGAYETFYWDTTTKEESLMIQAMEFDEEERYLIDEIKALTIRERRFMHRISEAMNTNGNLVLDSVTSHKVEIFGTKTQNETTTHTIASFERVQKLENELTRIQGRKTRCIVDLSKLRLERRKLDEMQTAITGNPDINLTNILSKLGEEVDDDS